MTTQSDQTEPLFASFVALMLDTLAKLVPGQDDSADTRSLRRDIARLLFEAFRPRDVIEAMLAAEAVAAHCVEMDLYGRTRSSGIGDKAVASLCGKALAASRAFNATLRTLDQRQRPATQAPADVRQPNIVVPTARTAQLPDVARRPEAAAQLIGRSVVTIPDAPQPSVRNSTSLSTRASALAAQLAARVGMAA